MSSSSGADHGHSRRERPPSPDAVENLKFSTRRLRGRDAAVSELIGTLLLLGIAVVLVAGFVLVLFAVPGPSSQAHSNVQTYILPTEPDELVLEHRGGPSIPIAKMTASVTVNGVSTRYVVGDSLGAGWSVVPAEGANKTSADDFAAGDRAIFTSTSLLKASVSAQLVDAQVAALVIGDTPVQLADTAAPTFLNARVSGHTTITVNFTEVLSAISANEFTVSGFTIGSVRLIGNGSAAEFVVNSPAWTPDQTPAVNSIAGPITVTKDIAGNAFATSASVTPVDRLAPGITVNPAASGITTSAATITWTTNETGTSTVNFGPTPSSLGLSSTGASGTSHSVALSPITDSFTYYYAVSTTDAAGNTVTSTTGTFTTAAVTGGGGGGSSDGAPPNHLTINLTSTANSGIVSGVFNVGLRDGNNQPLAPTSPVTVVLNTNSTNGYFLDSTGATQIQTLNIPSGQTYASFRYVDFKPAGYSTITASAFNTTPDAVSTQVVGNSGKGVPYHLDFSSRTLSLASGATSGSFTITLKDQYDNPIAAPYALTIDLGTNSSLGYFTSGGSIVSSVGLSAGVSTTAAITYTEHRARGSTLLTAVTNATTPASMTVTVTGSTSTLAPGQRLVFSSVPQPVTAGVLSEDFRVELHDEADRLLASSGTVTVRLLTNTTRGYFTGTGSVTPIQSVNITGATPFADFRYVDARPGVSAIMGVANGTYPAIALVGVEGRSSSGEPDHLEFTTTVSSVAAGTASGTFTVALKNVWGETVAPPSGSLVATLSTNSSLGFFVSNADTNVVINSVTIASSGTASFQFKDSRGGRSVLEVSALNVIPAVAGIDITGGVALATGSSGDMILSATQTVTGAKTYNPGTLIVAGAGAGTATLAYANSASSITATIPANTGTLAMLNLAQTWTALQTYDAGVTVGSGQALTLTPTASGSLPTAAAGVLAYNSTTGQFVAAKGSTWSAVLTTPEMVTSATTTTGTGPSQGTTFTATASCPANKVVLGGGGVVSATQAGRVALKESLPASATSWQAVGWVTTSLTSSNTASVVAYAICA